MDARIVDIETTGSRHTEPHHTTDEHVNNFTIVDLSSNGIHHAKIDSAVDQIVEDVANMNLSDDEGNNTPETIGPAKRFRLEQKKLFKTMVLRDITHKIEEQEKRNKLKRANAKLDEGYSIQQLLQEQDREALNDPREYQLELFERAKKENTIAVLETGSGKTLIAVLLIRWVLDQELEDRAKGLPPRTTFFMVPSNTLVYQQTAVLKCNMDHGIASKCGDMNATDSIERKAWDKRLRENMVVVCTPEILNQCLRHSLVTMESINLLVFDEAHHAKKNHPYAKIISDFYKPQPPEAAARRPRVFGMTASPIDSKQDLITASKELESLLDCKIATFPLRDEYRNNAQERTLTYKRLRDPFETRLYQKLKLLIGRMPAFERVFAGSLYLSNQLGSWAADKYWEFALREEEKAKAEAKMSNSGKRVKMDVAFNDNQIELLRQAHELIKNYPWRRPRMNLEDLSSKVYELILFLNEHYEHDLKNRCIIFVEQKATARMLTEILHELRATYLRPGLLTGAAAKAGDAHVSFKQQVLTMTKFRKGDINCLIATSVAEEGLDVPDCNLVIRFDLYKTVIQYVQSKGRARHKNSKFIDMVEEDNWSDKNVMQDARWQAQRMKNWIENLDPGRKIVGDQDIDVKKEKVGREFRHPKSGATLNYGNALGVLSLFASTLEMEDRLSVVEPAYILSVDNGRYFCEVVMPEASPIRSVFGLRYPRKALAKRSAAFQMCIDLLKGKFLNSSLLSMFEKRKPEGANAHLAVSDKKGDKYVMRLKPSMWADGRGTVPDTVWLTVVDVPDGLDRPHQPIGLVTRHPLPQVPRFPLFLDNGRTSLVHTLPKDSFAISDAEVKALTDYTLLLLLHVNAKKFEENNGEKMSYWVVPIASNSAGESDSRKLIDWEAIREANDGEYQYWKPGSSISYLVNKFIVDPWAGNRRFFSDRIAEDLKPLDDIPDKTAKFDRPGANKKKNILQYSVSLYGKKYDEMWPTWDKDQPVMECTQVMHRQNMLAKSTAKEADVKSRYTKAFLCPEPMIISALSPGIVTMFLVFPAIIHRIEEYLIALEAAQIVGIKISPALALEAMTKDSDNSDDHSATEAINFRPGMGNNYERLEFMGDCFLKTATSISLYVLHPHDDEFESHVARMKMICNRNLMNTALELKLTQYVRSLAFSRRLWYPEALMLVEGKGKGKIGGEEVIKHSLGDKSIADICEALIGAAFIQHNDKDKWQPDMWMNAIKAVTKLVDDPNHNMLKFEEYVKTYVPPSWQVVNATAPQRDLVAKIEEEQGYRFRWPLLLRCAFSHPSIPWTWEKVPSYQRLEFLGDALLDLACITHLFYNYADKNPQWLTEHKMAMVSNKFLGAVCVKIGFHRHMRHNHPVLGKQIKEYVDELELAMADAKDGEVDWWTHVKDPPKCLPDIVESFVGALFIDSNFDYGIVQAFFDAHIKPFFADMTIYDSFANNHPTTLLHHTLSQVYGCQAYQLLCEQVDPNTVGGKPQAMAGLVIHMHDEIIGGVVRESGRYAREAASKKVNSELQGLTVREFKNKFNCDCKAPEDVDEEADANGFGVEHKTFLTEETAELVEDEDGIVEVGLLEDVDVSLAEKAPVNVVERPMRSLLD